VHKTNFSSVLPHPQGLTPFWSGNWAAYAQNPGTASHAFSTGEGSGTAIGGGNKQHAL
jgi:photosystem I P700 chlorophyll a apoprotein A2